MALADLKHMCGDTQSLVQGRGANRQTTQRIGTDVAVMDGSIYTYHIALSRAGFILFDAIGREIPAVAR